MSHVLKPYGKGALNRRTLQNLGSLSLLVEEVVANALIKVPPGVCAEAKDVADSGEVSGGLNLTDQISHGDERGEAHGHRTYRCWSRAAVG